MEEKRYWERFWQQRSNRRRVLHRAALGGAGLAATLLAGCTGRAQPGGGSTASEAGQPKRGGTFSYNALTDPPGFDMVINFNYAQFFVNSPSYNALLRFKIGPDVGPASDVIEPDLAKEHERIDELTFRFTLHPGVKFHSGDELSAEDVKKTLERLAAGAPTLEKGFLYSWIDRVEAVDKYTVKLNLKQPYFLLLYALAWRPEGCIVHKATLEKEGDLTKVMNGTGPFKLESFERGNIYRYVRHPHGYFKEGLPYLDAVNYFIIRDTSAALTAFRTGQVDVSFPQSFWMRKDQLDVLQRQVPRMQSLKTDIGHWQTLDMRSDAPPFNDQRLRNAISVAIDRQNLVDVLHGGDGYVCGWVPAYLQKYHVPVEQLPNMKQDLQRARALFSAAGFAGGTFEFKVSAASPETADLGSVLKQQLAPLGITININIVEHAAYLRASQTGDFQMTPFTRVPALDPDEYTFARFTKGGPRNFHRGFDQQLEDLCYKQRTTTNEQERIEIVKQIQRRAAEINFDTKLVERYAYPAWHANVREFYPHVGYQQYPPVERIWKAA
jgi:peptide/nickel transport system substrate-binding protein